MSETITKTNKPRNPPEVVVLNPPVLSVLNYGKRELACGTCGAVGLTYACHDARRREEGGGDVLRRCKGCAEEYAAAHGLTVYVKSTWPKLREVWKRNKRLEADPARVARLEEWRAQNKRSAVTSGQSVKGAKL